MIHSTFVGLNDRQVSRLLTLTEGDRAKIMRLLPAESYDTIKYLNRYDF
jgi:hypothetical protein